MLFNRTTCINNLFYLVKKRGIPIDELESACGAVSGYISQLKEDDNLTPDIAFLARAAEKLETSVDTLIGTDLSLLTATEEYLLAFLEKIIVQTQRGGLHWEEDHSFAGKDFPLNAESDLGDGRMIFQSAFAPNSPDYVPFEVHACRISEENKLYLIRAWDMNDESYPFSIELYMAGKDGKISPVCWQPIGEEGALDDVIDRLNFAVRECESHPFLDAGTQEAIDAYLAHLKQSRGKETP